MQKLKNLDVSRRKGYIVLIVIFFILGSIALFLSEYERKKAVSSISWPIVQGQITKSYNDSGSRSIYKHPQVRYEYYVNGQQYTGYKIAWNDTYAQLNYDAHKRFPVSSNIDVHYCPSDPRRSCLEIGSTNILNQRSLLALMFFMFATLFFVIFKIRHKNN